jgi:hypothetical protein
MLTTRWRSVALVFTLVLLFYFFAVPSWDGARPWQESPPSGQAGVSDELTNPEEATSPEDAPQPPKAEDSIKVPEAEHEEDEKVAAVPTTASLAPAATDEGRFNWGEVPERHPVRSVISLPTASPSSIPRIQHTFDKQGSVAGAERLQRLDAVKGNFTHAWQGYKTNAWLRDEVKPISGQPHDPFGGWAATLVDSLGTLLDFP